MMLSDDRLHQLRARSETWTDINGDGARVDVLASELYEMTMEILSRRGFLTTVTSTYRPVRHGTFRRMLENLKGRLWG